MAGITNGKTDEIELIHKKYSMSQSKVPEATTLNCGGVSIADESISHSYLFRVKINQCIAFSALNSIQKLILFTYVFFTSIKLKSFQLSKEN